MERGDPEAEGSASGAYGHKLRIIAIAEPGQPNQGSDSARPRAEIQTRSSLSQGYAQRSLSAQAESSLT